MEVFGGKRIDESNPWKTGEIKVRCVHFRIQAQGDGGDLRVGCEVSRCSRRLKQLERGFDILRQHLMQLDLLSRQPLPDDRSRFRGRERIAKNPWVGRNADEGENNRW